VNPRYLPDTKHMLRWLPLAALALLLAAGCATTGEGTAVNGEVVPVADDEAPPRPRDADPSVTLQEDFSALRDMFRLVGETHGGNVAVVEGIGLQPTNPVNWQRTPYRRVVEDLARHVQAEVQDASHYYFVYPPGYEALLPLSLQGMLGEAGDDIVDCAFGEGTPLFDVFALLSKSLNRAIVADNILAESTSGEIILNGAPLWAVLEAVLKSARVVPGTFEIDVTEEYIFLHASQPQRPRQFLSGRDRLTDAQRQALGRTVTVELAPQRRNAPQDGAQTLEQVLTPLSQQMGVAISTEARLRDLPVNPVYLPNVRVETALDLIVRQWPYPIFIYRFAEEGIRIVTR